jgi:hypothetical protein
MNENPPEVFVIFLETMIKLFDVSLVQEAQHLFLELPATLTGDNLDQLDFSINGFLDDAIQLGVDLVAAIIDVMQVEFEFCHTKSHEKRDQPGLVSRFIPG